MAQKTIYTNDKDWATIQKFAKAKGLSVSTLIQLALDEYMRAHPVPGTIPIIRLE